MLRLVVISCLLAYIAADGYYKPKTNKCFQCSYNPPKTVTYKVPKKEEYEYKVPKTTYECKEEKVQVGYHHPATVHYAPVPIHKEYPQNDEPKVAQDAAEVVENDVSYDDDASESEENTVDVDDNDAKSGKSPYAPAPGYGYAPYGHPFNHHGHGHGYYAPPQPAFEYRRRCYPKVEYETRKSYRTTYEDRSETSPAGGFAPCMGPITAESGKADGVDDWDCESNCFTRTDGYGNVVRGCYKGEFGVNPHLLGCHYQAGQKYCFCKGDHCNGEKVAKH